MTFWEEDGMGNIVIYAKTEDGLELPVIDVTNPVFAVSATEEEMAAMLEQFIRESQERGELPAAVRQALQNSLFGRALMAASGTYLDAMSTYQLKLGPDNLGAQAAPIDRRIAGSFPAFSSRIRMQDMARLLAEGLTTAAAERPHRELRLVNIGGGVAADSWNALIHLQAERPGVLAGRKIIVTVMDADPRGPAFGLRALEALRGAPGPLRGVDIRFEYLSYEWSETERLRAALESLAAAGALCAISSEGALFEYGSDAEIVANLRVLREGTAADAIAVGSVTRDGAAVRASARANGVATRPRTLEGFRGLAAEGGWVLQTVVERPFSFNLRMARA
jgi:hypothetical protein